MPNLWCGDCAVARRGRRAGGPVASAVTTTDKNLTLRSLGGLWTHLPRVIAVAASDVTPSASRRNHGGQVVLGDEVCRDRSVTQRPEPAPIHHVDGGYAPVADHRIQRDI
jgi:hypothetical protein